MNYYYINRGEIIPPVNFNEDELFCPPHSDWPTSVDGSPGGGKMDE